MHCAFASILPRVVPSWSCSATISSKRTSRPTSQSFAEQGAGARILLKEVADARRFGVPAFDGDRIVAIEEKPEHPKSSYAVTGVYMYDARVFDYIRTLSPSARGELEITDVNNRYLADGELRYDIMEGWWSDAGTFESLLPRERSCRARTS